MQLGNDLAILVLDKNSSFVPIQMPKRPAVLDVDDKLMGLGWGRSSPRGSYDDALQEAVLDYVKSSLCWRASGFRRPLRPGMLCLGGNGVDMCYGQSPASLLLNLAHVNRFA